MLTRNQEKKKELLKKDGNESTPAKKLAKTENLVDNIVNSIQNKQKENVGVVEDEDKKSPVEPAIPKRVKQVNIRGKPKSGRPWKDVKQKFSKIKKSMYRPTFEKKEALRHDLKHIKELSKSIKENKKVENEEKRLRRAENAKRRLENERKNEIVQVIKNPAKLKRMKKKALRQIEKRDLANVKTA